MKVIAFHLLFLEADEFPFSHMCLREVTVIPGRVTVQGSRLWPLTLESIALKKIPNEIETLHFTG